MILVIFNSKPFRCKASLKKKSQNHNFFLKKHYDFNVLSKKTSYFLIYFYSLLNKYVFGYMTKFNRLYLFVKPVNLLNLLTFLKINTISSFDSLLDIAVVDRPNQGFYRFELNYVFLNYTYNYRFILKIHTDGFLPIFSINNFYKSSNWLEREAWDMFGIKFFFHPNLRRILTDYGFKGHPLRKDFPLIGYVDLYYDDSIQAINISPLKRLNPYVFINLRTLETNDANLIYGQ